MADTRPSPGLSLWLLVCVLPALASAESYVVYHAQTQTNVPPARALASAVLQHSVSQTAALGRYVWLFGGLDATLGALNDLWRLDMQSNTWVEQAPYGIAPVARRGASLVLAEQRHGYLFGGETSGRQKRNDLFILQVGGGAGDTPVWEDITTNATGAAPSARTEHSATVATLPMLGGSPLGMLVFGGADASGVALSDLYSFEFSSMSWTALSPTGVPPQARKGHTACLLLNSLLAVFGGSNQDVPVFFGDVHIYDMNRGMWFQPAVSNVAAAPDGRDGHSMVLIDDTVYIFGGVNARGEKLADLWAFNVYAAVSGQLRWSQPTPMSSTPPARWGHLALSSLGAMHMIGGTAADDALLSDAWRMSAGCSGHLSLSSARGVFSDGDGTYRNGLDCRWRLAPSLPHTQVRVVITLLDLLDPDDKIEIYDGPDLTSPLLASYTGSTVPPSITGSQSELLVRLTTDAAGDSGDGFQAAYQAVCTAGYTWDTVSASCTPCPAGSYAEQPGSMSCTPCAVGFYATTPGGSSCDQCPAFSTTSTVGAYLKQACTCQPGYFGWNSECRVCAEGASCPGGNLVAARAGWCETTNASTAVPTFAHCCRPSMCAGGSNAMCDGSVGLVGEASCSVQLISWDTLGLVSLTTGTWITFVMIVSLALLICFCTGLSIGVRRAVRRQIDSLVVPVPAAMPPRDDPPSPPKPKPSFTPVEPLGANLDDTADTAPVPPPRAPVRTPDATGSAAASFPPSAPPVGRGGAGVGYSTYQYTPQDDPPYSMARQAMYDGRGGSDDEVMEISLDDASALGSAAPPPQLGATMMPPMMRPTVSAFASEADPARGSEDEAVAAEAAAEEEETTPKPKPKGKKGKKGAAEEEEAAEAEAEEGDADEGAGKKKKKSKGKKGKGEEGEGEAEAEGGEKKKKKKKKGDAE